MTRTVTSLVAVALPALAPSAFAQDASDLAVSEAEGFMGMWLVSDQGPFDYSLDLKGVGGKVAATLNNDFLGESMVTDITKAGDNLTLKWEGDMQGRSFRSP